MSRVPAGCGITHIVLFREQTPPTAALYLAGLNRPSTFDIALTLLRHNHVALRRRSCVLESVLDRVAGSICFHADVRCATSSTRFRSQCSRCLQHIGVFLFDRLRTAHQIRNSLFLKRRHSSIKLDTAHRYHTMQYSEIASIIAVYRSGYIETRVMLTLSTNPLELKCALFLDRIHVK